MQLDFTSRYHKIKLTLTRNMLDGGLKDGVMQNCSFLSTSVRGSSAMTFLFKSKIFTEVSSTSFPTNLIPKNAFPSEKKKKEKGKVILTITVLVTWKSGVAEIFYSCTWRRSCNSVFYRRRTVDRESDLKVDVTLGDHDYVNFTLAFNFQFIVSWL